jgi:uracil DNA glycosylase
MQKDKAYWVDKLGEDWTIALRDILKSPYMERLLNFLAMEGAFKSIYPNSKDVFKYFKQVSLADVKVIISYTEPGIDSSIFPMDRSDEYIDSYHHANYVKISECVSREYPDNGVFTFDHFPEEWISQGVLLLPRALTVPTQQAGAHLVQWRRFYEAVLQAVVREKPGVIWFMWGDEAKQYADILPNQYVYSWECPSKAVKQSRDWHCPNFKQANELITKLNGDSFKIIW